LCPLIRTTQLPGGRNPPPPAPLRAPPAPAARLAPADGGPARLTTKRASVVVTVEVDGAMSAGHLALPNGLGVDHPEGAGRVQTGVAPNELTASEDRDPWVGTPWHKSVAARLEAGPATS